MNAFSLLNGMSVWDTLGTLVDVIPKVIYLLFACIASAVDAMQMLVRRLCGLDVYYVNGSSVELQDPLTEFINGILGIGNSSGTMQALNTTFWSLAIFALILLALTSIVAIIKSHYNEDSGKTNPTKIIYNAIKSAITFVIVPVVVVIGFQLSSLLLRTLDNITAGATSEESLSGIYGSNAMAEFVPSGTRNGENIYTSYEMFGIGAPATNSPIFGQIFRSAAYNCNRVRTGKYSVSQIKESVLSMNVLGEGPGFESAEDQSEYLAYQIDYAFINNLQFKTGVKYYDLKEQACDYGMYVKLLDLANVTTINHFSKYNTSLIWIYYDLWNFNFIIAFAGALSCFGIMISIIIGLMMRLIKSAAMFLIYPPLLGLAPMDEFKAFKSWSNEFIKQILSAFGAIVGINLLFLILPFVQSISFFNNYFLDSIVNIVFLATGLIMAKDFISLVSGFVGGGDVFSTGEGAKSNVAKTIGSGTKLAVGAGAVTAGTLGLGGAVAVKGYFRHRAKKRLKNYNQEYSGNETQLQNANADLEINQNKLEQAQKSAEQTWQDSKKTEMDAAKASDLTLRNVFNNTRRKARRDGMSAADADRLAYSAVDREMEKKDVSWKRNKQSSIESDSSVQWYTSEVENNKERISKLNEMQEELSKKIQTKASRNYLHEDGSGTAKGAALMLWNTARMVTGPLKLFAKDVSASLNVDKLSGQIKQLSMSAIGKDAQGNDAVKRRVYEPYGGYKARQEKRKELEKEARALGKAGNDIADYVKKGMKEAFSKGSIQLGKTIGEALYKAFPGANIASAQTKFTGDKLQQEQLKATQKQTAASEETSKKIDKLISTMESFVKARE